MTVHLLKCFGAEPGGGNPALVIENDHSGETARQTYARERNVSACVFIDRQPDGAIVLDYFYPHTRSPLCLHATLAATHILLGAADAPESMTVTTAMRGQALPTGPRHNRYPIRLAAKEVAKVIVERHIPSE